MIPRALWHYIAALYFALQSLAGTIWWLISLANPPAISPRPFPMPGLAPPVFEMANAALFVGAALWTAGCLVKHPASARGPWLLHSGAALCGALYCVAHTLLTGQAMLAAITMTLSASCGAFVGFKATSSH